MTAPLYALVLAGGRSTRMGRDKAAIESSGITQLERAMALLKPLVTRVFVSVRREQRDDALRAQYPLIVDEPGVTSGPIAGIVSAQRAHPDCAWLVVACDLPHLDAFTVQTLIAKRDPARVATSFRSSSQGLPEPLCAIYEPAAAATLAAFIDTGGNCPRKFLLQSDTLLLDSPNPKALANMNTPADLATLHSGDAPSATAREVRVQYFALLREQAGRREETVATRAATPLALYAELAARHRFTLSAEHLKVAINTEFCDWSRPLAPGDAVVFIPPVAGG